jgi:hypothetical protein
MFRIKYFLDFAKEEKWLNEMAHGGWELVKVDAVYHFQPADPQDALIRIDYRNFHSRADYENYVTLFEDSGWQHVAGSRHTGLQYFKRVSPASAEDIFSDDRSRAERFQRFARIWFSIAMAELLIMIIMGVSGAMDLQALIQPRHFYLTPGLWERQGAAFWSAFWFETPFALFRAALMYFFPIAVVGFLLCTLKVRRLYVKEKSHETAA